MKQVIIVISILAFQFCKSLSAQVDLPVIKGPYLGQNMPEITPEIIGLNFVSTENISEGGLSIGNDGMLFIYHQIIPNKPFSLYTTELKDGKWTTPSPTIFNSDYDDWDSNFAPDGKTLYFTSRRPAKFNGKKSESINLWVTTYSSSGWTVPEVLDYPINTHNSYSAYPSVTSDGTIYFCSERDDGFGKVDLYCAKKVNGKYDVEILDNTINTDEREFDPCIAPDESYLIFMSNKPNEFSKDGGMYISFRNSNDSWTTPKPMGELLSDAGNPALTTDGKYLLFVKGDEIGTHDMYWIDARIIEELKK